jgi:hypothetical protein
MHHDCGAILVVERSRISLKLDIMCEQTHFCTHLDLVLNCVSVMIDVRVSICIDSSVMFMGYRLVQRYLCRIGHRVILNELDSALL